MTTPFFLNESIPDFDDNADIALIEQCVKLYITKIQDKPVSGVFHTSGNNISLYRKFPQIKDRDLQNQAYRLFTTTPQFPVSDDELLAYGGHTNINGQRMDDAFGYIAAHITGGFLFTIPVFDDLKKDLLPLYQGTSKNQIEKVRNFFGENYQRVIEELEKRRKESLGNLQRLEEELPAIWRDSFQRCFEKLCEDHQKAICRVFLSVKEKGYQAKDSGEGMKHVGAAGNQPLYELKVFRPVSLRVFFALKDEKVWIVSMMSGKAGKGKDQDEAISNAKKQLGLWLGI